jgi:plastocyanin
MSIRACVVALCAAVAVAVGCESRQSLPVSPSVSDQGHTISADSPSQFAAKTDQGKTVTLMDACDPDTFNAPPPVGAGPGTCERRGGVQFSNFLDELARKHSVGAWHMAPGQVTIKLGDVLSAFNNGGEVHTFTEVDEFGGGFVQALNTIGGFGATIPECNPQTVQLLHPGDSSHETTDEVGVERYQCCIHPWMRAEVHIVQH